MSNVKYQFNEHDDLLIRKNYAAGNKRSGAVNQLAKRLGCSRTTIHRRAVEIGAIRTTHHKRAPWTEEQNLILEENAHKSLNAINQALIRKGHPSHSLEGIRRQLWRLNLDRRLSKNDAGIYSQADVCRLMGCYTKTVQRHIRLGLLKAEKRADVAQTEYLISAKDLKQFIVNNISVVDFATIDKYWLVDLLTGKHA